MDFKDQKVTMNARERNSGHYYIDFICKRKIFCYNIIAAELRPLGEMAGQSFDVNH